MLVVLGDDSCVMYCDGNYFVYWMKGKRFFFLLFDEIGDVDMFIK